MAEGFRIRDTVHGFLGLCETEAKLLGTRLFQRLRGIRQLALANLVYPGALHTRFDHSLGVCHIAQLMAEQLGLDQDESRLVRIAALLHDVGHGPFSHVSEHLLERYANRDTLQPDQKKDKIHELVTNHWIRNDDEMIKILGQDTCDQVAALLSKGHGQPALRSIVSGPLDADKQDYLLRDSKFCGVEYGVFDIHQLHRSLLLHGPDDDKQLMIAADGIHAVEQYVLAKYYLTTSVYRHRVRLITDQMIVRALMLGIDVDGSAELRKIYTFDNTKEFFDNYAAWDDAKLLLRFGPSADANSMCGKMLDRLQARQLHKLIYSERIRDFAEAKVNNLLLEVNKKNRDELRSELEKAVADIIKKQGLGEIDPKTIIVHGFDIKSVRTSSRNDEGSIMVARYPKPQPFEEESPLFSSINEGYSEGSVEVYAPISWPTRADRRRVRAALRQPIKETIESIAKNHLQGGNDGSL
jgi:uncharacterized protein